MKNETKKNWKLVNFCEFDKYATKSYCAIHNVDESLNLGDITKVDETKIDDFNMMTWGFPCTDISCCGKQSGFIDKNGEKTRSGLYYDGIRILREKKPTLSIIENVKNLTSQKFKNEFEIVLNDLDEAGYNSYYKILNAKDFGIPQNRERIFIISIRKGLDNGKFVFPEGFDNGIRLKDILEDEVDEKFYISDEKVQRFLENLNISSNLENENIVKQVGNISACNGSWKNPQVGRIYSTDGCSPTLNTCSGDSHEPKILKIGNTPKILETPDYSYCLDANYYKGTTIEQYTEKHRRQLVTEKCEHNIPEPFNAMSDGSCRTIKAQYQNSSLANFKRNDSMGATGVINGIRIRKLTPKECFRLMSFSDSDYEAAKNAGISNSQLYKMAGNSIVVDVLYYILIELYKAMPYLFDDLKLSSFFSGIGAFEKSLDRLYEGINTGNFTNPQVE